METLTIPKKLAKQGDLVLIPRREYDRLLADSFEKAERDPQTDRAIVRALAEVAQGKVHGPFTTAAEGVAFLRNRRRSLRKK